MILALLGSPLAAAPAAPAAAPAATTAPGAPAPAPAAAPAGPARRWELAAGPWIGQFAPQELGTASTGLAWGGRLRGRWTEVWAAELVVGTTPTGATGSLALVRFLGDPSLDLVGHVALGAGMRADRDAFAALGGGLDVALTPWLDLRADGRIELDGAGDAALLFAVSPIVHTVRRYDTDGDGVLDRADRCGRQPEDRDGHQDDDGCPDPDNDGDGTPDLADACPDTAEDPDGLLDRDGCPDTDDDEDGVFDALDSCPRTPEDIDGFADADGCPDPDNDADTVRDESDRCADVGEDLDAYEDDDGCPEPDNDGDGVADRWDGAPLEPETHNGWEDADGVPDAVPPVVTRVLGALDVRFVAASDTGPARVEGPGIAALGEVLASFPTARVEVHVRAPDAARAATFAEVLAAALAEAGAAPNQLELRPLEGAEGVDVLLPRG